MNSDQGEFWNHRYVAEGAIWGEEPSPSARLALRHVAPGADVLDVGFGYGRDLVFLARNGCRVAGIDLSGEGQKLALARLERAGIHDPHLQIGRFEDHKFETAFDLVLSHRLAHLIVDESDVARFVEASARALKEGGLLCVGARDTEDLDVEEMKDAGGGIYEYRSRPGHRIRYWSESYFHRVFGKAFSILTLHHDVEVESKTNPVRCRFTIMLARKKGNSRITA